MLEMAMVRPFTISTPQEVLDRIFRHVAESRIGYAPSDDGQWQYGTDARYLGELVAYWRDRYDWRAAEADLNRWPQFKAEVDGIDIHFYHVKGDGSRPFPLLLTHGWPGSVVEFQRAIGLLNAAGFDLVVPSLPGYGWSGRPDKPIGPKQVAGLWRTLMVDVLGYPRFGAQGGDWGSIVTSWLGKDHGDVVAGIHLNMFTGPPPGSEDDADTLAYRARVAKVSAAGSGYSHEQMTKPQTIGLALADNPVGFAAWVVEKFHGWGDTGGDIASRFSMDMLLTNIMTYLVNDAVISSIWMYYGFTRSAMFAGPVTVPTGLALYPAEFIPYPNRRDAARVFDIRRWTEMQAGGHFAALEEPEAFSADVIAFFDELA
jgi:pimeloyl-ACP methyl ester carboxylesterase